MLQDSVEHRRLLSKENLDHWRRWGPYVAERAWGTVREDYSADGDAWNYFPHDLARSKAYRWGEDGIAGICDRYQRLVFSLALWNGQDPFLKERMFGLTNGQGNHGEDVKEYYFYLDNTPTHSYMRYLYKYPHAAYPYELLEEESRRRTGMDPEFELLDTGIFDQDRYFDVFLEYAKYTEDDICIQIEAFNRGPEAATIHLLPHLWYRNTWSWTGEDQPAPSISLGNLAEGLPFLEADDSGTGPLQGIPHDTRLGKRYLFADAGAEALFTDNETNGPVVHGPGNSSKSRYTKDAFHRQIVDGEDAVNPACRGTKAALHYVRHVPPGGSTRIWLRLTPEIPPTPLLNLDRVLTERKEQADEFYAAIHPARASEDEKRIQRQALSGMLWNKQIYLWDLAQWMDGDNPDWPPPASRQWIRNRHWRHMNSKRVLSMPDKWEYPWFAAWDLAFHTVTLALVDADFAKEQLWLLLFEQFQHPNGQIPAYEWEFSDLNPPVHAWAVWRVYNMERVRTGKGDREFLEKCFHKLLINFAWWVNRLDSEGNNVFEGGFLGLDNIAVIDRSERQFDGATLEQSDSTGWMGMFCLNLMRIALELAEENRAYEGLATKFFQHYVYVGAAMKHMGGREHSLWSEKDGFFYDVLKYRDGSYHAFQVRSLVGIIPLYAVERLEERWMAPFRDFGNDVEWFLRNRQDLVQRCIETVERDGERVHILAVANVDQLRRILERVWNPDEFRSQFGLRSLSRHHDDNPVHFGGKTIQYEPGEARSRLKGGNSNWRGPIWFPTTFLLIESLRKLGKAHGGDLRVTCDDGSPITLDRMARSLADRLISLFTVDEDGRRPAHGRRRKFQEDPHWKDYLLFYEYFDGDSGEGLGASHQTGWTGLIANLIDEWRN